MSIRIVDVDKVIMYIEMHPLSWERRDVPVQREEFRELKFS